MSALVGLLVLQVTGPDAWAAAFAVGLAHRRHACHATFHPPAGINPLLIVVNALPWSFLAVPVAAGALLLVAFAVDLAQSRAGKELAAAAGGDDFMRMVDPENRPPLFGMMRYPAAAPLSLRSGDAVRRRA